MLIALLLVLVWLGSVYSFSSFTHAVNMKRIHCFAISNNNANDDDKKGINCETEGSCRTVRAAFKAELEENRQAKRREGGSMEPDYLEVLSKKSQPRYDDEASKKSFSPFRKPGSHAKSEEERK
jgi:hypothetical protein